MEVNQPQMRQLSFSINDASAVSESRRAALRLARICGLDEAASGRVALVVTEAATNLVKHAIGGELLLRILDQGGISGVEVLALDRGPGIANLGECLRDGFSTAGSPGTGLGAINRLSDEFDIHSMPEKGTTLVSRISSEPAQIGRRYKVGAVCSPKPGETVCGDGWEVSSRNTGCSIIVADGLGHGPDAAAAALEAIRVFKTSQDLAPADLILAAHGALRSTRGAAVAIAELTVGEDLKYTGVGNISGVVLGNGSDRHLVSYNGIVGHEIRKIREFTYPWTRDGLLIMHSDGVSTHWSLNTYPGLVSRDPSIIAAVLYRDYSRERDDVTVVVIKQVLGI